MCPYPICSAVAHAVCLLNEVHCSPLLHIAKVTPGETQVQVAILVAPSCCLGSPFSPLRVALPTLYPQADFTLSRHEGERLARRLASPAAADLYLKGNKKKSAHVQLPFFPERSRRPRRHVLSFREKTRSLSDR